MNVDLQAQGQQGDASASISTSLLIKCLSQPCAYPHSTEGGVEVHETHISIVLLAGEFAYKIKKPIKTDFLDYSTLELRRSDCEKELRLDGRYANDLYLGVVPIGWDHGRLKMDATTAPVEYAVKMRRFARGSLLSERIEAGDVTTSDIRQLADTIASFHCDAAVCDPVLAAGWPGYLADNFQQIFANLQTHLDRENGPELRVLRRFVDAQLKAHLQAMELRVKGGLIRECHGDLHAQNVVDWGGRYVPFDGIEFNERLRWIDVLCDAAFLSMDLAYRERLDLARSFMNAYLEQTGDYHSLVCLRLYLIYRTLVRAIVATMRAEQQHDVAIQRESEIADASSHVNLAYRFTLKEQPKLWITHGFSGSGKTTKSEFVVMRHDVIRLRSDVERKRIFGLKPTERPSSELRQQMYGDEANERTYSRLQDLARRILKAGYGVIIDAAFLQRRDREQFHSLADELGVSFAILDCSGDIDTLRHRIAARWEQNQDASDAELSVLEHQLATNEPLSDKELAFVICT